MSGECLTEGVEKRKALWGFSKTQFCVIVKNQNLIYCLSTMIMGVFLDSLGEVGCMVSVPQARLCKNGNLNLNANKTSTSNFAYAA